MSEPASAELQRRVKDLEREVAAVRKERQGVQRRAADKQTVQTALSCAARDRSALSSSEVEAARAQVQHLLDELVDAWDGADRTRHLATLLKRGFAMDYGPLNAAFAAETETREQFRTWAATSELSLPTPTSPTSLAGPAEPAGPDERLDDGPHGGDR